MSCVGQQDAAKANAKDLELCSCTAKQMFPQIFHLVIFSVIQPLYFSSDFNTNTWSLGKGEMWEWNTQRHLYFGGFVGKILNAKKSVKSEECGLQYVLSRINWLKNLSAS